MGKSSFDILLFGINKVADNRAAIISENFELIEFTFLHSYIKFGIACVERIKKVFFDYNLIYRSLIHDGPAYFSKRVPEDSFICWNKSLKNISIFIN